MLLRFVIPARLTAAFTLIAFAAACAGPTPTPTPYTDASTDRAALEILYHATDGPNWTNNANWLSDRPLGEWDGVTTDADGRVTELLLDERGLSGLIPPELGTLANLETLDLGRQWAISDVLQPFERTDTSRTWQPRQSPWADSSPPPG